MREVRSEQTSRIDRSRVIAVELDAAARWYPTNSIFLSTRGHRNMTSSKTPPETAIIVLRPLACEENHLVIRRQVVGTASIARFPTLELERERLDQLRQILLQ